MSPPPIPSPRALGRTTTSLLVVAFGVSSAAAAHAQETGAPRAGLTADDVARRATATSVYDLEKRRNLEEARANLASAYTDFFPRLALAASYTRYSKVSAGDLGTAVGAPGAPDGPLSPSQPLTAFSVAIPIPRNSTQLQAKLTVPVSDYLFKLGPAYDAAQARVSGARLDAASTARKTRYDARTTYYDWVEAALEVVVARQNLELANENLANVKARAAADSASPADVARVESTAASSELTLVKAMNVAQLERERVAITMHEPVADWPVGEDLRVAPPAPGPGYDDIERLVGESIRRRPELAALAAQTLSYQKERLAKRATALPNVEAFAQGADSNPHPRRIPQQQVFGASWYVGAQLTYAPNDIGSGLAQARASQAKADASDAQRLQLLDALRLDVVDAVMAYRNGVSAVGATARRVSAAEVSYHARRELYRADHATLVELTEAQTDLFQARLDAVKAQVEIRVARTKIAYVSGQDM